MTRDEIIRIAQELFRKQMKEADQIDPMRIHYSTTQHENAAVCVVALAIASAEREACAKVCEEAHWSLDDRNEYAAAIRARGQE